MAALTPSKSSVAASSPFPRGRSKRVLRLLHKAQVFRFIILKPALRAIYPSLTSQFVLLTLTTSIASAISAYELTSVSQLIESESFRSFEVYFTVTLFYLVISWVMMRIFGFFSAHYFNYPVK